MIVKVGKNIKIKPGFTQCKYVIDDNEILLSTILKGTTLDDHHHVTEQFGYCIDGSFSFCYGNSEKKLQKGGYYILGGDIPHSALADEDFYALDFKYLKQNLISANSISADFVTLDNCSCTALNVSEHFVVRLESCGSDSSFSFSKPDYRYILFSEKNGTILLDGKKENVEAMELYSIPVGKEIRLNGESTVYAVIVKRV